MKTITVATFNDRAHAEGLRAKLEAEHIHTVVTDESRRERLWFVGKPLAGVRLNVSPQDHDRAADLLRQWDVEKGAVRCPECGQSHVEYPQFTRKFLLPNLIGIFSALGLIEKEYYCEDCHHTWGRADARPPRVRAHMAPNYFIEDLPGVDAPMVSKAAK